MIATIFTVGHGTRTTSELSGVLRSAEIELVVDVRRFPGSRRHPHFAREELERSLPEVGIAYEWWGETLGGRRETPNNHNSRHTAWRNAGFRAYADYMDEPEFRTSVEDLMNRARSSRPAIMCAERLWWNCHRRLIADALELQGCKIIHLLDETHHQRHPVHDSVRLDESGRPTYDVGATAVLDLGE